ncbi:DUF4326 domain-containing protein [Burkholderia gladioli]|uniref:DUF4326 domain-containing protein n=1 Tax=Burkholderia gladioli TaxID=28095 RepID=UPI0016411B2C|nr:DUF4326 domain-containing protein [Burkholderia gladioli]
MRIKGSVRVENLRASEIEPGESTMMVDRSHPILGNRHFLKNRLDHAERAKRLDGYRQDLDRDFERHGPMYRILRDLARRVAAGEDIVFLCWCKPLPCHGDILAEKVYQLAAQIVGDMEHGSVEAINVDRT